MSNKYIPIPMPPFCSDFRQLSWWARNEYENGNIIKAKRIQRVADRIKMRMFGIKGA